MENDTAIWQGAAIKISGTSCSSNFPSEINSTESWLKMRCDNGGVTGTDI